MFYSMSGVFVQMLLYDAEKQNTNLKAEVAYMENYKALESIKTFEEIKAPEEGLQKKKTAGMARLPTLGSSTYNNDPAVMRQLEELKEDNVRLNERANTLALELSKTKKNTEQVTEEAGSEKRKAEELERMLEQNTTMTKEERDQLMGRLSGQSEEIEKLKDDLTKKINQLPQVNQMKKMLQSKNDKIQELTKKLAKYEDPEDY